MSPDNEINEKNDSNSKLKKVTNLAFSKKENDDEDLY